MSEDIQTNDDLFEKYTRKTVAEIRPYVEGEDLSEVEISELNRQNGSPKEGDKIARNPLDKIDQWLISKEYFEQNYEKLDVTDVTNEEPEQQKDDASE